MDLPPRVCQRKDGRKRESRGLTQLLAALAHKARLGLVPYLWDWNAVRLQCPKGALYGPLRGYPIPVIRSRYGSLDHGITLQMGRLCTKMYHLFCHHTPELTRVPMCCIS